MFYEIELSVKTLWALVQGINCFMKLTLGLRFTKFRIHMVGPRMVFKDPSSILKFKLASVFLSEKSRLILSKN